MPRLNACFKNDSGAYAYFVIADLGDPNVPKQVFSDYLDYGQVTPALLFYVSDSDVWGHAQYTRSGGATQLLDITDGGQYDMN